MNYEQLYHLSKNLSSSQMQFLKDNVSIEELLELWIMSFAEHTMSCDMCTLTWSDKYCDDYILFQKMLVVENEN